MDSLDEIAAWLADAKRVLFITGAGISADSGLPTYRGVAGMYEDGRLEDGLTIERIVSAEIFEARPELTWKYLRKVEWAMRMARPNAGHLAIAAFERVLPEVWTLTQNVDGLHRLAGSQKLIEIHGNLHKLICTGCQARSAPANFDALGEPVPLCLSCGAIIRPEIVLFDEPLPETAIQALDRELDHGFDLCLSVGTSSQFEYIIEPVLATAAAGNLTVEITLDPTELSALVDRRIEAGASSTLATLFERLEILR